MSAINVTRRTYLNGAFYVLDSSLKYKIDADEWYKDAENWSELPRGKADCYDTNDKLVASLRGMPKFGDDRFEYGAQTDQLATTSTITEKANGECVHITFFKHKDEWFLFGGSKNVHVVVRAANWVHEVRELDTSTSYAYEMVLYFLQTYKLSKDAMQYISDNKLTLVGEFMTKAHPHIVKYDVPVDMKFFAITSPQNRWCMNPEKAQQLFKAWGLPHVSQYKNFTIDQVDVKNAENLEGYVEYKLNAEGEVVMVKKHKALQYALLRAVRECLKSNRSIQQRLATFHESIPKHTRELIVPFFYYCMKYPVPATSSMYEHYEKYLEDKTFGGLDDKYEKVKIVVIVVGVPGTGKTTLGSILAYTYLKQGVNAVYIDQDLCHSRADLYNKRVVDALYDNDQSVVVIGKSNTTMESRRFLFDALEHVKNAIIRIVNLRSSSENLDELVQRVEQRKHHVSLTKDNKKLRSVISRFLSSDQPLSILELQRESTMLNLEFTKSLKEKLDYVLSYMGRQKEHIIPMDAVWFNWIGLHLYLTKEQTKELLECVPAYLPVRHTSFHVTLAHSVDIMEHVKHKKFYELFKRIGDEFEVEVSVVIVGDVIAACLVDKLPEELYIKPRQLPHITLAKLSSSVPSVKSNELCTSEGADSVQLKHKLVLRGKLLFN